MLIASVCPLRAYICTEGLVRICAEQYVPPNPSNLRSVFAHLTNYSLNKHHRDFVHVGEEELTAIQRRASFDDRLEQLDGGGGGGAAARAACRTATARRPSR